MEITEQKEGEILVIELSGRLDSATSEELESLVSAKLTAGETRFLIDLQALEYVSSAGLRVFVMLAKQLIPKQGKAVLCSPTEAVQEIFDMVRLSQLLRLVDSRETAYAELRG
jgi:anti-anti-sigma factor